MQFFLAKLGLYTHTNLHAQESDIFYFSRNTTHCMQSCGISSDSIIEESEEGALINVISSTGMYSMTALSILTRIQYKISFANNLPLSNDHSPAFGSLRRQHERNKILLMDVNDDAGVSISDCKLVLVM